MQAKNIQDITERLYVLDLPQVNGSGIKSDGHDAQVKEYRGKEVKHISMDFFFFFDENKIPSQLLCS